ncbi:MAG: glycosyltransferase, partial [Planctomycetota bacterium]
MYLLPLQPFTEQPGCGVRRSLTYGTSPHSARFEGQAAIHQVLQTSAGENDEGVKPYKRVLVVSASFPSTGNPIPGVFVKERVRFVSQLPGVQARVISPVPFFPPIKYFKRWYPWSQMPRADVIDGLQVERPRYFMPPKFGGYVESTLMYPAARQAARRLRREFDFDLIDAHFVYASGVVAFQLGRLFRKPVVITCRGEDILRFPDLPVIGNRIRAALQGATRLVALSKEIADALERQGADPSKVTVIPNGVDADKFQPMSAQRARQELGLPQERPIVVSVGYRIERKGFHVLVDAIP